MLEGLGSPILLAILFALGMSLFTAVCTLVGVALGGHLVYRTKRESYEDLFGADKQAGEIVQLADDSDPFAPNPVPRTFRPMEPLEEEQMPDESAIMAHHLRFMEQLGAEKAKE